VNSSLRLEEEACGGRVARKEGISGIDSSLD
jgi:hypothetical protein